MKFIKFACLATLCVPMTAMAQDATEAVEAVEAPAMAKPETAYVFTAAGTATLRLMDSTVQNAPYFDPADSSDFILTWGITIPREKLTIDISGLLFHEDLQSADDNGAGGVDVNDATAGWFLQQFAEETTVKATYKVGMFTGVASANLTDETPAEAYVEVAPVEGLSVRLGKYTETGIKKADTDQWVMASGLTDDTPLTDDAMGWANPTLNGLRIAYTVKSDTFNVTPWFAYTNGYDDANAVVGNKRGIFVGAAAEVAGLTPSFAYGMADVYDGVLINGNLRPVKTMNVGLGYKMEGIAADVTFLSETWAKQKVGVTNEGGKLSGGTDSPVATDQSLQNIKVAVDGDSKLFGMTNIQAEGGLLIYGVAYTMNTPKGDGLTAAQIDGDTLNSIDAYAGYALEGFKVKLGFDMDTAKSEIFSKKGTGTSKSKNSVYLQTSFSI